MFRRRTTPADPLREHFSGKRRYPRVRCVRDARVLGRDGDYDAHTLDLSPGGVLLELTDPAFYVSPHDDTPALALVERAFPGGMRVHFPLEDVTVPAEVVRITPHRAHRIGLGCRFVRPLDEVECLLLGVTWERSCLRDGDGRATARVARGGARVSVLVYGGGRDVLGPRLVAPVGALRNHGITAHLAGDPAVMRSLATDLAGQGLRIVLLRGRRRIWTGRGRLLACPLAPDGEHIDVHLLTDSAVAPGVQRYFRPVAAV